MTSDMFQAAVEDCLPDMTIYPTRWKLFLGIQLLTPRLSLVLKTWDFCIYTPALSLICKNTQVQFKIIEFSEHSICPPYLNSL